MKERNSMHTNQLFKLECFQDLDKNKYVHPFYQTNRGHLIISGDQQYKNDYVLSYILRRIPDQYKYKEMKIIMHSLSIGESNYPMLTKYLKKPTTNTKEQLMSSLLRVRKAMNDRYKTFYEEKAKDIYAFNQKVINKETNKRFLPHLLVIVHEVPQTDNIKNDRINDLIHEIVIKSRAAGIHMIITSSTIKESISPVLKYHMDAIVFKVDSSEKSKILIGDDEATKIKSNELMVHESLKNKNTIYKLLDVAEKRSATFANEKIN
jgi:DNA segregation ATPase FtsK/SpoIIIE-like protein